MNTLVRSTHKVCKYCVQSAHRRHVSSTNLADKSAFWVILEGFGPLVSRKEVEVVLDDLVPLSIEPLLDNQYVPLGDYALQLPNMQLAKFDEWSKKLNNKAYGIRRVEKRVMDRVKPASKSNITDCTVRIRNTNRRVYDKEKIYSFFENFDLRKSLPGGPVVEVSKEQLFFVHFDSPEEAQRAVAEKSYHLLDNSRLKLFWYQC